MCVLYKKWNDFQLAWEPEKFGNVSKTRVPISKLWFPDLAVINRSVLHEIQRRRDILVCIAKLTKSSTANKSIFVT